MVTKLKKYRGTITPRQFAALVKACPKMTDEVCDEMQDYFVAGIRPSHVEGRSKQAILSRVKYYADKGVDLCIFNQLELFD